MFVDLKMLSHDTIMVEPAEKICVLEVLGLVNRPSEYVCGGGKVVVCAAV
jgi:hypothetical protein